MRIPLKRYIFICAYKTHCVSLTPINRTSLALDHALSLQALLIVLAPGKPSSSEQDLKRVFSHYALRYSKCELGKKH